MAVITRPTKTGGNTTYVAEVAAGQTKIKAVEVDGDLNLLYATINNLDGGNIADGSINTADLTDLAVTTAKLGALAVTTAKLADDSVTAAKIATDAVGAAEIAAGAVGTAELGAAAVTLVKISSNATVAGFINDFDGTAHAVPTTEGLLEEVVLATPRGGLLLTEFVITGSVLATAPGTGLNSLTLRLREGGTAATVDGTVVRTIVLRFNAAITIEVPWSASLLYAIAVSNPGRYKLTGVATTATVNDAWFYQSIYSKMHEAA